MREEFTDPAITTDPADLDDIGLRPKTLADFFRIRSYYYAILSYNIKIQSFNKSKTAIYDFI